MAITPDSIFSQFFDDSSSKKTSTAEQKDRELLEQSKLKKNNELVKKALQFVDELTDPTREAEPTNESLLANLETQRDKLKKRIAKYKKSKVIPRDNISRKKRLERANKIQSLRMDLEEIEEEIEKLITIMNK